MERFTGQQRAFCVKQFYKNNDSYVTVRRLFRIEYGLRSVRECPSVNLIKAWVIKFEQTGSTTNIKQTGRPRSRRSDENIREVEISVRNDPESSTRKRSAALAIPRTSLRRILHLDLKLHPNKLQIVQEMKPNDYIQNEALTCNVCDRSFPSRRILADHQQKKRHFGCSACDSLFPSLMALEHHKEEFQHWSDSSYCSHSESEDSECDPHDRHRLL